MSYIKLSCLISEIILEHKSETNDSLAKAPDEHDIQTLVSTANIASPNRQDGVLTFEDDTAQARGSTIAHTSKLGILIFV